MPATTHQRTGTPPVPLPAAVVCTLPGPPLNGAAWLRLIRQVTPDRTGAHALDGEPLPPATRLAALPPDAVLVRSHRAAPPARQWDITVLRADATAPSGLREVAHYRRRSPLGQREVTAVTRLLAPDAARHRVLESAGPTPRTGPCRRCGTVLDPGQAWEHRSGQRTWLAHPGPRCPAPPGLLAVNPRAGRCARCRGWIPAGAGQGHLHDPGSPATGSTPAQPPRYLPVHTGPCPAHPRPGPATRHPAWCRTCLRRIDPGAGHLLAGGGAQHSHCPPQPSGPAWLVTGPRRLQPGQVTTLAITPGPGSAAVPLDAPGARVLDRTGRTELVVLVDDALTRGASTAALVRPATAAQAAPLLTAQLAADLDAAPLASRFRARLALERICGDTPWVAEITGHHRDHDLQRRFLPPERDYADARDTRAWRGVRYCWTLRTNTVYQAAWPTDPVAANWRAVRRTRRRVRVTAEQRAFLRVTADGDIETISREQVEAWLRSAAAWTAAR